MPQSNNRYIRVEYLKGLQQIERKGLNVTDFIKQLEELQKQEIDLSLDNMMGLLNKCLEHE
ncbi:hypothetical protein IHV09_19265 [Fictibacillus sp. 23RED33]|uniref:hypothetical protein n=1 Tax=Fictibacillus sp. 23RED33 TaxID=2745879 RepID=UPI0018CE2206|nr:hypothetical protein [Fictibacillus sp. 23RED33]MBH0175716.1 hypothetical protein [Fictibacillus sp. 23RED33]